MPVLNWVLRVMWIEHWLADADGLWNQYDWFRTLTVSVDGSITVSRPQSVCLITDGTWWHCPVITELVILCGSVLSCCYEVCVCRRPCRPWCWKASTGRDDCCVSPPSTWNGASITRTSRGCPHSILLRSDLWPLSILPQTVNLVLSSIYRVWQSKVAHQSFFAVFQSTVWNFNLKFYGYISRPY